ncbi:pentapeptide repeat-containing protein [Streptomyces sp. NPDC090077]|uniref:pentapeptide repeat-containing protein n=1 Tax=Streptomyces sp. NPDC090077 TaxID=3365938 RepID=UPI00380F4241
MEGGEAGDLHRSKQGVVPRGTGGQQPAVVVNVRIPFPRTASASRGLRLWHVWLVLPLVFIAAVSIAGGVFYAGWDLLGAHGIKPESRIDSKTLFDLVKLSFGVVAGAGALVALIVAYRRQRVDEDGALRDATRLHSERFTTAVAQLGNESIAVRLGGVHALAGLADDAPSPKLRQTCIDVLCAYLRLPYTAATDLPAEDAQAQHAYLALREVRHTVIRVIRDRLGLDSGHELSWQGHDFDFTGVVFDGGDFAGAVFSHGTVSFKGAVFASGEVTFAEAVFASGKVTFDNAKFPGAEVNFEDAFFLGCAVSFQEVLITGGSVSFESAQFSSGHIDFARAALTGGTLSFHDVAFSGARVNFAGTYFGTPVDFEHARLSAGDITFDRASISPGAVSLPEMPASGTTIHFRDVLFTDSTGAVTSAVLTNGRITASGLPASQT